MIVTVNQKDQRVAILLQKHIDGDYVEAIARWQHNTTTVEYYINSCVSIPGCLTDDEAREYSAWYGLAASALETLKWNITAPADFGKQWRASIVGRAVAIEEVEAVAV